MIMGDDLEECKSCGHERYPLTDGACIPCRSRSERAPRKMKTEIRRVHEVVVGDTIQHGCHCWQVCNINIQGNLINLQGRTGNLTLSQCEGIRVVVEPSEPACTDEAMRFWEKAYLALLNDRGLTLEKTAECSYTAVQNWRKAKQDISEGKL